MLQFRGPRVRVTLLTLVSTFVDELHHELAHASAQCARKGRDLVGVAIFTECHASHSCIRHDSS